MTVILDSYAIGLVFVLAQVLAGVPWVAVISGEYWRGLFHSTRGKAGLSFGSIKPNPIAMGSMLKKPGGGGISPAAILIFLGVVLASGFIPGVIFSVVQDRDNLELLGKIYGSILYLQLMADVCVVVFGLMLLVWPKGGAVALAALREGLRQPMFYLLGGAALLLLTIAPFIPYFTFGEDFVMMQQLGFDTIMLLPLLLGVIAAGMSISEEIEGRTAVTLMSKPVSRRQFLLGKFFGILAAAMVMTGLLALWFTWMLLWKRYLDRMDPVAPLPDLTGILGSLVGHGESSDFLRGARSWLSDIWHLTPGLVLGFSKVMVLLALAVSLATRLPMIVNLIVCLAIYFLGHLTPVLRDVAERRVREGSPGGSSVGQLLSFTSQVFEAVLPRLDLFDVGPALVQDAPLTHGPFLVYIAEVFGFGVLFTGIALLVGLVLFEDRDLA